MKHSLRFRIVVACTLLALLIGLVFSAATFWGARALENTLVQGQLEREVRHWRTARLANHDHPLPHTTSLEGYDHPAQIPADLRPQLEHLSPGFHELGEGANAEEERHVDVFVLDGKTHWFILEMSSVGVYETSLTGFLVLITLLVTLLGTAVGAGVGRRVLSPVIDLADLVESVPAGSLAARLEKERFFPDEVGTLQRYLTGALRREEDGVRREQRFTRFASHELRTPVAVIKGATELMALSPNTPKRPLARIERSVREMERLIEVFLTLGQSPGAGLLGACRVDNVAEACVARHQDEALTRGLTLSLTHAVHVSIEVPETAVGILMENLILNALRHTDMGAVEVRVMKDRLEVQDSGPGIPPEMLDRIREENVRRSQSEGYGLGLSIIDHLSEHCGWRLEFENAEAGGLIARLYFNQSPSGGPSNS